MSSRFVLILAFLFALLFPRIGLRADPIGELKSFSAFETADLSQLKGDATPVRGSAMNTPRFQSVQTCWVSPIPPEKVSAALRAFNPAKHSDLNVITQVNGTNFSAVNNLPNNNAVQWLKTATESKSTDLQISREEAAKAAPFAQFWTSILSARSSASISGQPSYDHSGKNIRPGEEINSLLAAQPKIRKQFGGIVGGKGDQYWEVIDADGKGAFVIGTFQSRTGANNSAQVADVLYYASGGLYAGMTLYQLWPVQVDGKPSTLVWRGDLISSGELDELRGVERLGSETALIKSVARSVRALRSDMGGR